MAWRRIVLVVVCVPLLTACATGVSPPGKSYAYSTHPVGTKEQPRPTVLLAHGCNGVGGPWETQWLHRLKHWGYNGVIVDSFTRRGHSNVCNRALLVSPYNRADDLEEVAQTVRKENWHRGAIAVIGMSHGGATALVVGGSPKISAISASVALYPGCMHIAQRDVESPRIPTQVHLGEKDHWTPVSSCMLVTSAFKRYHSHFVYPNAGHAYDIAVPPRNYMGHFLAYDQDASDKTFARIKAFLDDRLKK